MAMALNKKDLIKRRENPKFVSQILLHLTNFGHHEHSTERTGLFTITFPQQYANLKMVDYCPY